MRGLTEAPILVMTSKYKINDHAETLQNGADFYGESGEAKVNMQLVLAIVKRIDDRRNGKETSLKLFASENVLVIPSQYKAFFGDVEMDLSVTEVKILKLLMSKHGALLTYKQIYKRVYGKSDEEASHDMFNAMKRLRKKIKDTTNLDYIENVRDVGYRLIINAKHRKVGHPAQRVAARTCQWPGHSKMETTLIYAHADTEKKRRAIEKASESERCSVCGACYSLSTT